MKINKKEFMWSMITHLTIFVAIWLGMCISNTWDWFGTESLLMFGGGFIVSGLILLTNKNLYENK